jgi:hypothetical protein
VHFDKSQSGYRMVLLKKKILGDGGGRWAQIMHTYVNKCKNNKIELKNKILKILNNKIFFLSHKIVSN